MKVDVVTHYDLLIEEGNDPVLDPPALKAYMDQWDGQTFLDLLELNRRNRVLEIGCGTGRLAVKVAPFVKSFCGIDISPRTITLAKSHLPCGNTELICADFLMYPFQTQFDLIYSSLTLMHIQDKEKAIRKIARLLTPSGRLVLSIDKNQDDILDFGTRKLKIYPDTPENIIDLLKQTRFVSIQRYETEYAYLIAASR